MFRIQSDPDFFAGFGSGIFTSGSYSGDVYLLSNYFQKDVLNHVKVFTIHYVNGISWQIHFLQWGRIRFWTKSDLIRIRSGVSLEAVSWSRSWSQYTEVLAPAPSSSSRSNSSSVFNWCSYTTSNHTTKLSQNVYVIKRFCVKRLITKRLCHTTKAIIKRQASQVNITKRQMFQNITSQNENRH